jgi:eukaryotic-like serine/threonine-protein kinase
MTMLAELRRRRVPQVAAVYGAVAWLLVQVVDTVAPALRLPEWTVTFVTVLLLLGFPVALILAWTFDVVRTRGDVSGAPDGIAVLPFANMTGEAEHGHLADGIVEDLLTRLHAADSVRVVSRQSSHAYQGRSADARTIARELGCRYVVEGSVRKVGDRVRVTAQLIDAPADRHLWAERYDRRLEDAFQLQDEICEQVVAAIQQRIGPAAPGAAVIASPAAERAAPVRRILTGRWTVPLLLALGAMAALLTWTLQKRGEERWAREEALPRLQALIAADDYAGAFDLAHEIERVSPNDPLLRDLKSAYSAEINFATAPAGAKVFFRPYVSTEDDWRLLGETPLTDVAVPRGVGLWRIEKAGHDTVLLALRNPGAQLGNDPDADLRELVKDVDFTFPLPATGTIPAGMVFVPAIPAVLPLGSDDLVQLSAFYIDRFEVTNREFKEFVDAAGYQEAAHWRELPFEPAGDGWQKVVGGFADLTGRPGPSSWEAGTYPDGTADLPVTGISWFEAAAYCRFRGKELPTAVHWYRAASSVIEYWESLASAVVLSSNFAGRGVEPVGRLASTGPFGTFDMAGNAREWLWTAGETGRWIAGGGYNDPRYLYMEPDQASPLDRSASNGVRCMRTLQGGPVSEELRAPILAEKVDYPALQPVSDDAYAVLAQQLEYRPKPFTPRATKQDSSNPAWTRERVELPTGYDDTTFAVQLFLPTGNPGPHPVVFYGPHGGDFSSPVTTDRFDPTLGGVRLDFLLKSGWALAVVAFDGSFERQWPAERRKATRGDERYRIWLPHWREELGRTIDYLGTRGDIDAARQAYFGISMGADALVPMLAAERRIGAAVLYSGGGGITRAPPTSAQAFNYLPRVTQPVLMLNGRWDIDSPPAAQQRMFELLGAPADRKKQLLFDTGHGNLPRFQIEAATLEWLDQHLGVATGGTDR